MPSAAALALGRVASRWKCPSAALPRSVLEAAAGWLRLCVFVLLSRFMASCHCTAALFGKVVTLSFSGNCHIFTFKKICKNLLIKQNMKQKTFGFYFFQKSKFITKLNFSVEQCPCQNSTVSRKFAAKMSRDEASLSLC